MKGQEHRHGSARLTTSECLCYRKHCNESGVNITIMRETLDAANSTGKEAFDD
jgi:hypothetical protein